jgi:hypothetical protein
MISPMGMGRPYFRQMASVVLIVLAGVLLVAGTVTFYAREQVIDRDAFADRAVEALQDDGVRTVVGREIVVYLVERGSTDLVAARPLLESVVGTVIQSEPFRRVFRSAALETNRIFFVRGRENALFDLSDAARLVQFGLGALSPKLAKRFPDDLEPQLLTLRRREFAGGTLAAADTLRVLGILLPLLSLAAFAGAVAIAPDRRLAVLRSGVAVGAGGALLAVVLLVLRARTLAGVHGEDELTDQDVRDAVGGLLDAYVGDLFTWALVLALFGLVLGAAAAALDPTDVEQPVARLRRRLLARPRTARGRAARGAAAVALGIAAVVNPLLFAEAIGIAIGAYLVFFGASELLALLQPRPADAAAERSRRRALVAAGASGAVVVAALVAVVVVVTRTEPQQEAAASAGAAGRCNGSAALCRLPLDEVVFAGTHNSFSAADSGNWYIANQRRTIKRQLADGIRLFLIDPHWGVLSADGSVRTDFATEGRDRNRVAKALPPAVLSAAERLAGRVGVRGEGGGRDIWLCHTVCELGATRMDEALDTFRDFLEENPGEVVILFIEPYVTPGELAAHFDDAGLDPYLATLDRDALPTLGQLVASDRRMIVFSEKDAAGSGVPWYLDGFSFVQDTPLGATKPKQLSCARERGETDSPLLMLNHWADLFPPRREANGPFLTRRFILARAHRCARRRGQPVNLIAVDHYDVGGLVGAVRELNDEAIRSARSARQ